MIEKNRLIKIFTEIAHIPGLSRREGKIAREIAKRLIRLGVKLKFDDALVSEGETGNLIGYLKGTYSAPPLLLNAHLDTVGPIEPYACIRKGNFLKTRGKSILGADDRSGVAVILAVIEDILRSKKPRPDLELVFTVAEEIGLLGSKNLNYSMLNAKYGIVLDSDSPFEIVVSAPEAYRLYFRIYGKSSHAGVAPEQGINAIKIASNAISKLKLGRIDFETTTNIGIISGGRATNIVPDLVEVKGEARSHNRKKLKRQIANMRNAFKGAVKSARSKKFPNLPKLSEEIIFDYPLMKVSEKSPLIKIFKQAGKSLGMEITTKVGGGGSDANIFNAHRIESIILGSGMQKVHTIEEMLNLDQFYQSALILERVIEIYPLVFS